MNFKPLISRPELVSETKLGKINSQFSALLSELQPKVLNANVVDLINESIESLNNATVEGNLLAKLFKQKQTAILKLVEKEHKIVPKNHYRLIWMLFGMSGIGIPFGVAFGLRVGNLGLLSIGIPFGMGMGIIIGTVLDKKALKEGRQLNIEIKN